MAEFDTIRMSITALETTANNLTSSNTAILTQLASVGTGIDALKSQLDDPTLLQRTPAFSQLQGQSQQILQDLQDSKAKVDDLIRRADAIGVDGQAIASQVSTLKDKVGVLETTVATAVPAGGPPGLGVDSTVLAATVATAVSQVMQATQVSGHKWTPLQVLEQRRALQQR